MPFGLFFKRYFFSFRSTINCSKSFFPIKLQRPSCEICTSLAMFEFLFFCFNFFFPKCSQFLGVHIIHGYAMYIVNTVLHQGVPINDDDDNAWLSLRFQAGEVASSHEVPLLPPKRFLKWNFYRFPKGITHYRPQKAIFI